VRQFLKSEGLFFGSDRFKDYFEHCGRFARPKGIVTQMFCDGPFSNALAGWPPREPRGSWAVLTRFESLVEQEGFWFEKESDDLLNLRCRSEEEQSQFDDLQTFRWCCQALLPHHADANAEALDYFYRNPDRLRFLSDGLLADLMTSVFRNNGLAVQAVRAVSGGGTRLMVLQDEIFSDVSTLVEALPYDPEHPITIHAVALTEEVARQLRADRSVLVSASSFDAQAQRYAERRRGILRLLDPTDLAPTFGWVSSKVQSAALRFVRAVVDPSSDKWVGVILQGHDRYFAGIRESKESVTVVELESSSVDGFTHVLTESSEGFRIRGVPGVAERRLDRDGTEKLWHADAGCHLTRWNGTNLTRFDDPWYDPYR